MKLPCVTDIVLYVLYLVKTHQCLQCAAKKVSTSFFCHFLHNRLEFLHEISLITYS